MSEWLAKIDVTTTLQDVLTRPSAFNPYPEHADGGIEVGPGSSYTGNPRYTVHYPKVNAWCRVTLPIQQERPAGEGDLPDLLAGPVIDDDISRTRITDPENWAPLADFWEGLSVDMASRHLRHEGNKKGAFGKIGDLVIANALPQTSSSNSYISPEPRGFVRQAIEAIRREIQEGRPEVGYAMTTDLFLGFGATHGGCNISTSNTMRWVADGLPQLLFPNFAGPWRRELEPHRATTVAHPSEIGDSAADVITSNLSRLAIDAWIQSNAVASPAAIVDKISKLQREVAEATIVAAAELRVKLDEARRRFGADVFSDRQDYSWKTPGRLSKFVLDKITQERPIPDQQ